MTLKSLINCLHVFELSQLVFHLQEFYLYHDEILDFLNAVQIHLHQA
jgi:hypothetical protein